MLICLSGKRAWSCQAGHAYNGCRFGACSQRRSDVSVRSLRVTVPCPLSAQTPTYAYSARKTEPVLDLLCIGAVSFSRWSPRMLGEMYPVRLSVDVVEVSTKTHGKYTDG